MDDLIYKIALTLVPKVGAVTAKNLVSYRGGAKEVFTSSKKDLTAIPGIGDQLAANILDKKVLEEAEAELLFTQKHKIDVLFFLDDNYPYRLKPHHDAPVVLYYKGTANLNHPKIVSIVGTRKPTPYGKMICEKIIEDLQEYNVLVTSGLALGIDVTAHKKCLDQKVPTVGVLGHGLKTIYPAAHKSVAGEMVSNGGLLSEFPSNIGIEREHFPMRNRIIAGMCDALIVVQTANKGGSVISVEMANNYGKDVFAIPGRINDKYSEGCNRLIKIHKAALMESVEDLAYVMQWDKPTDKPKKAATDLYKDLNDFEKNIIALLKKEEQIGIDDLLNEVKLPSSKMAAVLLQLEFKGLVKTIPGKRYSLA